MVEAHHSSWLNVAVRRSQIMVEAGIFFPGRRREALQILLHSLHTAVKNSVVSSSFVYVRRTSSLRMIQLRNLNFLICPFSAVDVMQ